MERIGLLDNRTEEGKRKFYNFLKDLPPNEYVYSMKENKPFHSLRQSKYFHVICQIYAMHTGHFMEEIKDEFKRDRWFEIKVDKQGKEFKRLKKTSDLKQDEYASVITLLLDWGREKHPEVPIPRREDVDYAKWLEIESNYKREFSGF